MHSLVDRIEQYLKELLKKNNKGVIEIRRTEIARKFQCVPSQINYVLSTRFTLEQGYMVESRRGGGGYVRIIRLKLAGEKEFRKLIDNSLGKMVSQQVGEGLINRLQEEGFLTEREGALMRAVIKRETLLLSLPERDLVRSSILRAMLLTILRDNF